MPESVFDLRIAVGNQGEELADELAHKVMAAVAAFSGPDVVRALALARLTALLIIDLASKEEQQ